MIFTCTNCGTVFRGRKRDRRGFCSRTCSNHYHMRNLEIRRKISLSKTRKEKRVCVGCGKTFETWRKNDQRYCSMGCYRRHPWDKDKARPIETRRRISLSLVGNVPWNRGYGDYMRGNKNPNWNGGTSLEPYGEEFNDSLREKVRALWEHACFRCGRTEEENLKQFGHLLPVHHRDFNKHNNLFGNLLPLCCPCHGEVTRNRMEV